MRLASEGISKNSLGKILRRYPQNDREDNYQTVRFLQGILRMTEADTKPHTSEASILIFYDSETQKKGSYL